MSSRENNSAYESYWKLFIRFLHFGLLAWGGPVAQIAMIREELVDERKWITREKFNRILGVYQALPGPEVHEMCIYFGFISRGRLGVFIAGSNCGVSPTAKAIENRNASIIGLPK